MNSYGNKKDVSCWCERRREKDAELNCSEVSSLLQVTGGIGGDGVVGKLR